MKIKLTKPFSGLKSENWRNLIVFTMLVLIVVYYIFVFFSSFSHGFIVIDYLQYWFSGKIADVKGYSEVYKLSELRSVQQQFIAESGDTAKGNIVSFITLPLGYFSAFIIPFQFLSRISVESGFLVWTILNLALLISYLIFFLRKINPADNNDKLNMKLLFLFLISFAVFNNFFNGQVEVFILICAGEFIRQAVNKKPILSGLWLGGLLLKPPLLILIIPIFIIMRYWKVLLGFFVSSSIILGVSLILSSLNGMRELINIWTKVTGAAAPSRPELMSNWRMIGVSFDQIFTSTFGWMIIGVGIILTTIAVVYLVRHIPPFGSPFWVMTVLGVFTATLVITWHSHYHMAMALIPFLLYASVHKLLPKKDILSWVIVAPVIYFGLILLETICFAFIPSDIGSINLKILGFTGFILNMVIFLSVFRALNVRNLTNYCIP